MEKKRNGYHGEFGNFLQQAMFFLCFGVIECRRVCFAECYFHCKKDSDKKDEDEEITKDTKLEFQAAAFQCLGEAWPADKDTQGAMIFLARGPVTPRAKCNHPMSVCLWTCRWFTPGGISDI